MKTTYDTYLEQAFAIYNKVLNEYCQADKENRFGLARPDSVGEGRVGFVFFMVELLAVTKNQLIRSNIDNELYHLETYFDKHSTNNYTLINGRLSIGLLYLRMYKITEEKSFLYKAVSVAEEYYKSVSFFNNIINKNGYFDGISGILYFTHQLYLHTKHDWLLAHIKKYTLVISSMCCQGVNGVFWGGLSNKDNKNHGLANGTAGIAGTLQHIGVDFKNDMLETVASSAFDYEEWYLQQQKSYVIGEEIDINKYTLSNGYLGMELTLLNAKVNRNKILERLNIFVGYIDDLFIDKFITTHSYGLFSGLSGVGVALIEAANQLGVTHYSSKINLIIRRLLEVCVNPQMRLASTLEGILGIGYLCIRLAQMELPGTDLFFLPVHHKKDISLHPSLFGEQNKLLIHSFLSSSYKRTLDALQVNFPNLYEEVINKQIFDLNAFADMLNDKLQHFESATQIKNVKMLFEKESFKVLISNKVELADIYTLADIIEADRILQLPDNEFKNLQLIRPRGTWMLCRDSIDINFAEFTNESLLKFLQHYGSESNFYVVTSLDKLSENIPGMLQFIYEQFTNSTTVCNVIDSITYFFINRNSAVLPLTKEIFQAVDTHTLKANIEAYVVEGTKLCVAEGLLQINKELFN